MLIYQKEVHTFTFLYKKEKFEVAYTKEFQGEEIENFFEVQGDINLVKEVEETLNEHYLEIAELLAEDINLEEIDNEELYEERVMCEGCGQEVPLSEMSDVMEMYICNKCEQGEEKNELINT